MKSLDVLRVDHNKDDETQLPYVIGIVTMALVLSTAAVILRLVTRARILHTFGPDDAFMAAAQILTIGSAIAIYAECQHGMGRHYWVMADGDYIPYMKSFYASIILYNIGLCVVKMSILLQYRRIFTYTLVQRLTAIGLIFEGCWTITLSLVLPLSCIPVAAFWDPSVSGRCIDSLTIWYVMAAINLVTDFLTFSMPLPVIKSLQLPNRQKIMLTGVFCLGFFTCIISVYRITTLKAAAVSADPTWENTSAAIWSLLELSIGVLAACLPTLKPLFAMLLPRLFKSSYGTSGRRSGAGKYGIGGGTGGRGGGASRGYGLHTKGTRRLHSHNGDDDKGTQTTTSSARRITGCDSGVSGSRTLHYDDDGYVDVQAIKMGGLSGPPRGDLDGPVYHVTVTGGHHDKEEGFASLQRSGDHGHGIQTTTVVTQRVDSL